MISIRNLRNCDGCGNCVDNCPLEVLEIVAEKVKITDGEMCTDCGVCVGVCANQVLETSG
jgi:NAD-dependent dihydropyrimidine dehydrogenase PreA subunit